MDDDDAAKTMVLLSHERRWQPLARVATLSLDNGALSAAPLRHVVTLAKLMSINWVLASRVVLAAYYNNNKIMSFETT